MSSKTSNHDPDLRDDDGPSEVIQVPVFNEEDEFIHKYGEIQFQYIDSPKDAVWFIRPHALNYFKDGILFRTRGERASTKTELFLDLIYVGLIANLASEASEHASWGALLKYILMFIPYWIVWVDIKDCTNYYYNEDLSQKIYIIWILALLTLSVNSHTDLLESQMGAAYTIVPYMLCRLSMAFGLLIYSFYIPEHRAQQRLYFCFLLVTSCVWIPVIFVSTRKKIAISIVAIALEYASFNIVYHPRTKKLMGLRMSTALNIEHEVERFATFVTIAIGEFLYKVVATAPLGVGLTPAYGRGVFLLIIAYALFWIYYNGGTSQKAIHPLRHSAIRAMAWIPLHIPLIGAIVLAADAGGELLNRDSVYHEVVEAVKREVEEEPSLDSLVFFFTGGLFVALLCVGCLGLVEFSRDDADLHHIPRWLRVLPRIPIGVIILCLAFAKMDITLLMGITALLMVLLLVYESVVSLPKCELRQGRSNGAIHV